MGNSTRRTRKNYDGTAPTSHQLSTILPSLLGKINAKAQHRPDLILAAWPEIVGPRIARFTRATRFFQGELTVQVANSSLYSLLRQHEHYRLLQQLRQRFPKTVIQKIRFRIG